MAFRDFSERRSYIEDMQRLSMNYVTKKAISLQKFNDEYRHLLPVVVLVFNGYMGHNEEDFTFSSDEIYRITRIGKQKRVVLQDDKGLLLSFPEYHKMKFHLLENGVQVTDTPQTLQSLLVNPKIIQHNVRLQPFNDKSEEIQTITILSGGGDEEIETELCILQYVDVYEDKYLIGNILLEDDIKQETDIIPVWIPITVKVIEGIRGVNFLEYQKLMNYFKDVCQDNHHEHVPGNPEVMLFKGTVSDYEQGYDYIRPESYAAVGKAHRNKRHELNTNSSRQCQLFTRENTDLQKHPPKLPPKLSPKSKPPLSPVNPQKENPISTALNIVKSKPKPKDPLKLHKSPTTEDRSSPVFEVVDTEPPLRGVDKKRSRKISTDKEVVRKIPPSPPCENTTHYQPLYKGDDRRIISDDTSLEYKPKPIPRKYRPRDESTGSATSDHEENHSHSTAEHGTRPKPLFLSINRKVSHDSSDNEEYLTPPTTAKAIISPFCVDKHIDGTVTKANNIKLSSDTDKESHIPDTHHDDEPLYATYEDVKKPINMMTVNEIGEVLKLLKCSHLVEKFKEKDIDGFLLMEMDEEMIKEEFQCSQFDAYKIMKFAKEGWRPKL